ncbi:hypothetical protein COE51_08395 [Bacillus pseudomycoides]|nr:hypothetical protein COE51_08395 [Bacillus pseudomycoides]
MSNMLRQKAKDIENKIKEKAYYVKNRARKSISQVNHKFHRNKKLNRVGNCVSIAIALLIIVTSWLTATNWLFWIGVVSIVSNALLLIINLIKK